MASSAVVSGPPSPQEEPAKNQLSSFMLAEQVTKRIDVSRAQGRLDLTGLALDNVPPEVFESMVLISLCVDSNQLCELPADIKRLILLQEFSAKCNKFAAFPAILFEMSTLTMIDLSFNALTCVPGQSFRHLKALRELNLANNLLIVLPEEISQAPNLESLHVEGNVLRKLPDLGALKKLRILVAYDNKLQDVARNLPASLETIDLSRNDLSSLAGSNVCSIPSLQTLDLSSNNIVELPRFRSPKLEELAIADNHLESLSPLVDLPRLRVLDASRNALREVPFSLGALSELSEVYLRNNSIEALPPSIGMCQNLRMLDVSDNKLEQLPEELSMITTLTNLKLRHNYLNWVPAKMSQLPLLQEFDLYNNKKIANLPAEMTTREDTPARAVLRHLATLIPESLMMRPLSDVAVKTPDSSYRTPRGVARVSKMSPTMEKEQESDEREDFEEDEEPDFTAGDVNARDSGTMWKFPDWLLPATAGAVSAGLIGLAIFLVSNRPAKRRL